MSDSRRPRPFRRLALHIERIRIAARMRSLADLVDVPHELAEQARSRLARLRRRAEAVSRIIG